MKKQISRKNNILQQFIKNCNRKSIIVLLLTPKKYSNLLLDVKKYKN